MSYLTEERKQLEAKIKEQNLIHELVMINELLLMEENKLRKQVKKIPKLKQKILDLEKENQQILEQKTRIQQAREEAEMQRQQGEFCSSYYKAAQALAKDEVPNEVIKEKIFSKFKL